MKTLKNKLSEYIRVVAGGETVLVVDHNRVVAEIVPPHSARAPFVADAVLAEAVREGSITPPALVSRDPPARKPVMPFADLIREIAFDRNGR